MRAHGSEVRIYGASDISYSIAPLTPLIPPLTPTVLPPLSIFDFKLSFSRAQKHELQRSSIKHNNGLNSFAKHGESRRVTNAQSSAVFDDHFAFRDNYCTRERAPTTMTNHAKIDSGIGFAAIGFCWRAWRF